MPLLRFKSDDGNNYPDWEEKTLVEVCDIIGGGTPSTQEPAYWNGDIQWFTPTEINTKYVSNSDRTITSLGLQKSSAKLLPAGTVLVTTRATLGKMAIATKDCTTNQGFHSLIAHDCCNNEFLYYLQPIIKEYCLTHHSVTTFKETSKSLLEQCVIPIPSLSEQYKIANFLSDVDAQIENYQQSLNNLETQKKELLRQIFSQELRFKKEDGSDYPDWRKTNIKTITELVTKGTTPKKFDELGSINFIKVENIVSNQIKKESCSKINAATNNTELSRSILKENDILISIAGTLGIVTIVSKNILPANTNQALAIVRLKDKSMARYLSFALRYTIKKYAESVKTGGVQFNLNLQQIKDFEFLIPSTEEQQRIADFFSDFDKRIELERQRLQTMQELKKGLLQQMFC